jgi:hypothetical protein
LGARAYQDTYEIRQMDKKDQALVAAYAGPLRAYKDLTWDLDEVSGRESLRRVARLWVQLHHEGNLRPLPRVFGGYGQSYGAKEEVTTARIRVLISLGRCADMEIKTGDASKATSDILLALHFAQVNKQADLESVVMTSHRQRVLADRLRETTRDFSANRKRRVAQELLAIAREDGDTIRFLASYNASPPSDAKIRAKHRMPQAFLTSGIPTNASDGRAPARSQELGSLSRDAGILMSACCGQRVQYSTVRRVAESLGAKVDVWPYEAWSTCAVDRINPPVLTDRTARPFMIRRGPPPAAVRPSWVALKGAGAVH